MCGGCVLLRHTLLIVDDKSEVLYFTNSETYGRHSIFMSKYFIFIKSTSPNLSQLL